jgi:hypothetical protein
LLVLLASTLLASTSLAGERCAAGASPADLARTERGYWTWALGGGGRQQSGDSYYVALPDGTPNDGDGSVDNPVIYTGSARFSVRANVTLVLPLSAYIGEGYTRASLTSDDDPSQPPKAFFTDQRVLLTVDGRPVVDSSRRSLACQYFDATYFHAPVVYNPPEYRYTSDAGADVYAASALWVKGIAANLAPLAPGQHTIHLVVDTLAGWGYDNTWTVTVRR